MTDATTVDQSTVESPRPWDNLRQLLFDAFPQADRLMMFKSADCVYVAVYAVDEKRTWYPCSSSNPYGIAAERAWNALADGQTFDRKMIKLDGRPTLRLTAVIRHDD